MAAMEDGLRGMRTQRYEQRLVSNVADEAFNQCIV